MPNHVTTVVRVVPTGDAADLERFQAALIDGDAKFDFDKIIPCPASIKATGEDESNRAEIAAKMIFHLGMSIAPYDRSMFAPHEWRHIAPSVELNDGSLRAMFFSGDQKKTEDVFRDWLEANPKDAEAGRRRLRALAETGHQTWYGWNRANWGTKWGSYDFSVDEAEGLSFRFDTAWNFPAPIFEALTKQYPSLRFFCLTYDEGSNFAGSGWFNPADGEAPFAIGPATDDLYEAVYGHPPVRDEDEDETVGAS